MLSSCNYAVLSLTSCSCCEALHISNWRKMFTPTLASVWNITVYGLSFIPECQAEFTWTECKVNLPLSTCNYHLLPKHPAHFPHPDLLFQENNVCGYATIFYEPFQVSSNYCSFTIIKLKLLLPPVWKLHGTPHLAIYSIIRISNITAVFIRLKLIQQSNMVIFKIQYN
jgi:hypothetical protein